MLPLRQTRTCDRLEGHDWNSSRFRELLFCDSKNGPCSLFEHSQELRVLVSGIVPIELSDLPYSQTLCGDAMRIQRRLLALVLCSTVAAWAQGNSFDKIRYNGGSVDSKVDPKDWHNQLTVSSD